MSIVEKKSTNRKLLITADRHLGDQRSLQTHLLSLWLTADHHPLQLCNKVIRLWQQFPKENKTFIKRKLYNSSNFLPKIYISRAHENVDMNQIISI